MTIRNKAGEVLNKKRFLYYSIVVILLFLLTVCIYFLYFINKNVEIRVIGTTVMILLFILWFYCERKNIKQQNVLYQSNIKKFVLITRDGEKEKEWHCEGVKSFLIGKSTINSEVDIDLTDTYYAEYISPNHAVLNYAEGYWYIEDLNSKNGVGIKKRGEEYALRLKPMTSYKIDEGDVIYISKSKLFVR